MRTKTVNIYKFSELSDYVQQKVLSKFCEHLDYQYEWDCIKDDAKIIGLKIEVLDQHHGNVGNFLDDGKDCAQKIMLEHGESCETYIIARDFLKKLDLLKNDSLEFDDEREELETDFLHDLLECYRVMHEKNIEYMQSDKAIKETIECNEYEFLENGEIA